MGWQRISRPRESRTVLIRCQGDAHCFFSISMAFCILNFCLKSTVSTTLASCAGWEKKLAKRDHRCGKRASCTHRTIIRGLNKMSTIQNHQVTWKAMAIAVLLTAKGLLYCIIPNVRLFSEHAIYFRHSGNVTFSVQAPLSFVCYQLNSYFLSNQGCI